MEGSASDGSGNAMAYRLSTVEDEIRGLKGQLDRYVTTRENELKLQSIKESVQRIEGDVSDIRKQQLASEQASKERDVAQKDEQSRLQIKVLYGILSAVGGVVLAVITAVIIYFLTHPPA